jgi:hypothetical protein
MDGVPGLRCPECGREAKSECKLFRTRRHWWMALVGSVALLVGAGHVLYPKVRRDGPLSIVPLWVLVRLAPEERQAASWTSSRGSGEHPVLKEVARRIDSLSPGDWGVLLERCHAIMPVPGATRQLVVSVEVPRWAQPWCRLDAVPTESGLKRCGAGPRVMAADCGNAVIGRRQAERRQILGQLPVSTRVVEFDVTIWHQPLRHERPIRKVSGVRVQVEIPNA